MKATLPDGTAVEGSADEIAAVLERLGHSAVADAIGKMLPPGQPMVPAVQPLSVFPPIPTIPTMIWCACPKFDPFNRVIGWGGHCPVHSPTCRS